jgi:hypothetical protein
MNLQTLQEEFHGQEKHQLNGHANRARVRGMSEDERLIDTIPAFRVTEEVSKVVRGIVKKDRRTISDVARALLERGAAAYLRDGNLFEPEEKAAEANKSASLLVPRVTIGEEKTRKGKKANNG